MLLFWDRIAYAGLRFAGFNFHISRQGSQAADIDGIFDTSHCHLILCGKAGLCRIGQGHFFCHLAAGVGVQHQVDGLVFTRGQARHSNGIVLANCRRHSGRSGIGVRYLFLHGNAGNCGGLFAHGDASQVDVVNGSGFFIVPLHAGVQVGSFGSSINIKCNAFLPVAQVFYRITCMLFTVFICSKYIIDSHSTLGSFYREADPSAIIACRIFVDAHIFSRNGYIVGLVFRIPSDIHIIAAVFVQLTIRHSTFCVVQIGSRDGIRALHFDLAGLCSAHSGTFQGHCACFTGQVANNSRIGDRHSAGACVGHIACDGSVIHCGRAIAQHLDILTGNSTGQSDCACTVAAQHDLAESGGFCAFSTFDRAIAAVFDSYLRIRSAHGHIAAGADAIISGVIHCNRCVTSDC